ncbi:MAG: choice-of-anchor L domain-containing protein [Saprospiraceae bacterium]|nr:choice-of-anchor L domain-containing protein [Saprospiraceae bacterium]
MNCLFRPAQKLLLTLFSLTALTFVSQAQFLQVTDVVTGPYNPQSLISNVFLGNGVEVTNIQFTGDPRAVGYFSGGTNSIGIERGILLTTGLSLSASDDGATQASDGNLGGSLEPSLVSLLPPPDPGDPPLTLNDVAVYTITFIPNADTLRFRYSFGSEEYPEYSCSDFNDVFGFFIQGPGYPTFTNIALVPGTNLPVSINNIHPFNPVYPNCFPFNVQYYNDNEDSSNQPVYDGYTDVFTAMAVVTPCQPYTIKLAIADVGDSAYDSGVFLEAKSFGTGSLRVDVSTLSADATLSEGCSQGAVTFTLPEIRSQNYTVNFNVFGDATPGADYTAIPGNLVIPAGQSTITVPIVALEDNIAENIETIGISVQVDPCNRDTVYLYIRDKILLPPLLNDTSVCLPNTPITLNAAVPTPTPDPPTFSNQTDYPIPNGGAPVNSSVTAFGVQPPIIGPGVIRSVCINVDHSWIDEVDAYLISPTGVVLELTTDNGANGDDYVNTCFTEDATTLISFPGPFAPASAAPFTGNWLPEGPWSDLYGEPSNGNWRLRLTDDQNNLNGTLLDWTITFEPSYKVEYSWSPGAGLSCTDCPDPVATISQNSIYSVTATDSYGCTVTEDIAISIGELAAGVSVLQPIACFGEKGSLQVNAPGNSTYLWSTGQTSAVIDNLSPGTYTVTVTSVGASCSATASVTLTQPDELTLTASPNEVTCFGLVTGTAAVYPSGGVEPYAFIWSNGQMLDSISNLPPGSYTVTVTDGNGCQEISTMTVLEPAPIQILTALNRSPSCFGLSDGQLTTYAVGGTTPFTFVWNTGQVSQGINNITAGTYTVTATDGNGCTQVKTETVTEPLLLTSFATAEPVECFGENTGQLHLEAAGGTPQYNVVWTGPNGFNGSGSDLNNLPAGDYAATVTDANGCSSTFTVQVNEPAELLLELPEISDTICFFASNGSATALANGGVAPYVYAWNAGAQTTQTATGLSSNAYQVTITDANGCTVVSETFIAQQQELNTYAEAQSPDCHDGNDGTASMISIFYGATPANLTDFNYAWNTNPPQTGLNVSGLQGGQTYVVTATDALGCTATATVPVPNPFPIETTISGFADVKCNGDATGWAAARGLGGTAPYQWQWSGGATPNDSLATGLAAGTYRVTITDVFGCPGTSSVTIGSPSVLRVELTPDPVKCFGENTGSAKAQPSGGVGPYTFIWSTGAQTAEIQGLAAGAYPMSVVDANGCTTPAVVEIEQPEAPLTGMASMNPPRCFGGHDGRILLVASGGTSPYQYGLDNQAYNGSSIQIGITAGDYLPKIRDRNGCEFVLSPIEVTQPDPLLVDLGPDITIVFGQDTQLLAVVQNAQGAAQYAWAERDSVWLSCLDCRNPAVYSLEFSTYFTVQVTDSAGCRNTDQILISVEKPRKVHVPTGFTPNGDFINDLLLVHGQSNSKVLDFKVFDRWGEMVFQLKDFAFNDDTKGWDGTFRDQPCDPGVYVWLLEVEYVDGVREVFQGNTTLIR